MKTFSRAILRLIGILAPASLSCFQAEYGVPVTYSLSGKVVVGEKGTPIPGIKIDCLSADYPAFTADYTGEDGSFRITSGHAGCDQVRAEDVDGAENGGPYQAATVDVEPFDENVLIKLEE